MKLVAATVVYLLMSAVLCYGIYLMMLGKPWLMIVGFLAYVLAFAKIGCASH